MPRWSVALVTGASSGIGRCIATRLAADGTELVLVARRGDRLQALAEELRAGSGVSVEVMVADLVDKDDLAAVEKRLADGTPKVDLLVNSAGVGGQGNFADVDLDWHDHLVRLNVLAPVRLTHAALPRMLDRRRGGVMNISSIAGLQPLPQVATYSATKAYLTTFGHALHEEVRRRGVTVTTVLPGFTRTEFHEASGMSRAIIPGPAWMTADAVAAAGLRAVARGRVECVPGLGYRILTSITRITPWSVSRRVVAAALARG
jgi:short-subunit dehydrogenase